MLFFPNKNCSAHIADASCPITDAKAAPLTPRSKTKINIGSKIIFITAPIITVNMPILANP